MPRKETSTTKGKSTPPEKNLHDETAFKDLLVSDENLAKHTAHADDSATHDQVREPLPKVEGRLVDDIREERDQG